MAQDIPATDMLRLNYRSWETVPGRLRPVSNLTETGYTYIHMAQMAKYEELITLVTAGKHGCSFRTGGRHCNSADHNRLNHEGEDSNRVPHLSLQYKLEREKLITAQHFL